MKKTTLISLFLCVVILLSPYIYAEAYINAGEPTETPSASDASYDARDYGLVTAVKAQDGYGTCWVHAVCAVAESNMIKQGYADINVDYSELHLAYFASQLTDDPLGNFQNEGMELMGNAINYTFLSAGGDSGLAGYTLMRGIGLVDESVVPYSSAQEVRENGLDKSLAYANTAARLTDIYHLGYDEPLKIKQAIIDNGAVCTSLNDASSYSSVDCFNRETAAYYKAPAYSGYGGSHAVTIVGWDDTFEVENFLAASRPSSPGAWLIKDSAGTGWGDGGFWWASYEDVDFCAESMLKVGVLKFAPPSEFTRIYQYDGGSDNSQFGVSSNGNENMYFANMFTSTADEYISSVSFAMNMFENKPFEVFVYTDITDPSSPSSGDLAFSGSGVCPGGYMTVKLDKAVRISEGERFSIVVHYYGADDFGTLWVDFDRNYNKDGYFNQQATGAVGQSFYTSDPVNYRWTDYNTISAFTSRYGYANFRVKAHTTPVEYNYDINGDGTVNVIDLIKLQIATADTEPIYDLNGDGHTDTADIIKLIGIILDK